MKPTAKWTKGVGITGAEGSGKTTLIKALEGEFRTVKTLKELVRGTMKDMGITSPPVFGFDMKLSMKFQAELQNRRRTVESKMGGPFFADRTSLDSWVYTLSALAREPMAQEFLKSYFLDCMNHLQEGYHITLVVPHGMFAFIQADGVRNTLWYNALMTHYLILGAIRDLGVKHYIIRSVSLEDRVDEVIEVLHSEGLIA